LQEQGQTALSCEGKWLHVVSVKEKGWQRPSQVSIKEMNGIEPSAENVERTMDVGETEGFAPQPGIKPKRSLNDCLGADRHIGGMNLVRAFTWNE